MKKILGAGILLVLIAAVGGGILMGAMSPLKTQAQPPLPPRPTARPIPTPTPGAGPVPGSPSSSGGLVTLSVQADTDMVREIGHWRSIWTVVQWQDGLRNWHDVDGWQGDLDAFDGSVGWKTWWVAKEDLGTGPFRWALYHGHGGELLTYSEPFYLPSRSGQVVVVDASLAPSPGD